MSAAAELPRRGRPRDEDVDRRITVAALEVLAEHGAAGFSVSQVAARSAVAKSSIYRRFPTRDRLLIGAVERLNDDLATLPTDGTARDRLVALLGGIRRRQPAAVHGRLMMQVAGSQDPRLTQLVYDRVVRPRHIVLRTIIEDGVASGEFRGDLDIDALIPVLVGPMLYLRMWHAVPAVAAMSVEAIVDQLMAGMTHASDS